MMDRRSTSFERSIHCALLAARVAVGAVGLCACGRDGNAGAKGTTDGFAGSGGVQTGDREGRDGSVSGETGSGGLGATSGSGGASGSAVVGGSAGIGGQAAGAPSSGGADAGGLTVDSSVRSLPELCVKSDLPIGSLDVWSDDRGPYVLVSASSGANLFHLEGTAWRSIWTEPGGAYGDVVIGFPDGGDLLVSGSFTCQVLRIHDGATTCELTAGQERPVIVSANLAYALSHDRVLVYDGQGWIQYQNALGTRPVEVFAWSVWASEDAVAVTSTTGRVFISNANTPFAERLDLPADTYRVVWGLGQRLWVGGRGGSLISLDGDQLTMQPSVLDKCNTGIRGLWGTADTLYIRTEHAVFRYDETTRISKIHEYPCDETVTGFWGKPDAGADAGAPPVSPTLYVAVKKENVAAPACGIARIDVF